MIAEPPTLLEGVLARLARRFRFATRASEFGTTLQAEDLLLHIVSDRDEYTVIFEPADPKATLIHVAARRSDLEAVLRELLAG
jgi:hypothetical protein